MYLASAGLSAIFSLPSKTTVREKWLPAETIRVILLPAESFDRKQNHADSPAKTVRGILLLVESLDRRITRIVLPRQSAGSCFLPRVSAGSRITRTVSAGSYLSHTAVSTGGKRWRTVSAKYDGQSWLEAKIHFPLFLQAPVNIYRNQQRQQGRIGQLLLSSYSPSTLQVFLSAVS